MRWFSWVAIAVTLSGCFLRHREEEDPCQVPPAGDCQGTFAGADVSGPLDPNSAWVPIDGKEAPVCGDEGQVLVLSCAGKKLEVRAAFPDVDGDASSCGWVTDAPKDPPKLTRATLHQDEENEWRTHGTVDATFEDGSHVTIHYSMVDDEVCVPIPEPRKDNPIYKGIAFVAAVPLKVFSDPSHTGHAGHHHRKGGGHHHHHH